MHIYVKYLLAQKKIQLIIAIIIAMIIYTINKAFNPSIESQKVEAAKLLASTQVEISMQLEAEKFLSDTESERFAMCFNELIKIGKFNESMTLERFMKGEQLKQSIDCRNWKPQTSTGSVKQGTGVTSTGSTSTGTTTSGTGTEATSSVAKRQVTLKPSELFGPTKVSDKCYISQTESIHVIPSNGGMFATDIACNFGEGIGKRAEVYAPDLRDKEVEWTVEYVGMDELLGSFIQLRKDNESFYLAHVETKLSIGDKVTTGTRIGQMILNGATTGWHVHIEYRRLSQDGKTWKSERYFTGAREKSLDMKRKKQRYLGWKPGDTFYFTSYNVGDVDQNDKSACVGASGKNLCDFLRSGGKSIALTIDVRQSLGLKWGDKVSLINGNCPGTYSVEDEMNQRFRETGPGDCIKDDSGNYCKKGDIAFPLGASSSCSGPYSIYPIK